MDLQEGWWRYLVCMIENFLLIEGCPPQQIWFLRRYAISLSIVWHKAQALQPNNAGFKIIGKSFLNFFSFFSIKSLSFTNNDHQGLLCALRFPNNQISPEALLTDSIKWHKLFELVFCNDCFYMVFDQCNSHLSVLADDVDIFGAFDHDGCIVVPLLKPITGAPYWS